MRRRVCAGVIVLMLCFTISATETSTSNEIIISQVNTMVDNGDAKKALKILSSAIESSPQDLELLTRRADIYVLMEREKDAYKDLNSIYLIDDQYSPALLANARLKQFENQVDSALWYIDQALAFEPDMNTTESLYGLKGNILMGQHKYKEAETCLVKAAASPEVSIDTMRDLASVLCENGKNNEAALILKETLELFGRDLESYVNTGYVCNKIGLYDEAIVYLEDALSLESSNPYALANISLSYLRVGQLDKAFKSVEKSLDNENTNAYAYRVKGECLMQMGENQRACKEFRKAIQMGYSVYFDQTEITKLVIESCGTD